MVRELLLGPKRFTDLRDGLPGIGPNVLSQRLKELEEIGVLRRHVLPPPAASTVYELTEWGHELEDVLTPQVAGAHGADLPEVVLTAADSFAAMLAAYQKDAKLPSVNFGASTCFGKMRTLLMCDRNSASIAGDVITNV